MSDGAWASGFIAVSCYHRAMRFSLYRKRHPVVGARPGTLVIPKDAPPPRIDIIRYDEREASVRNEVTLAEVEAALKMTGIIWVDVESVGDEATMRRLGDIFSIHPLALEDVTNAPQRPKAEEYPQHLLLVARMASINEELELDMEQIAIFVGKDYVLSFQEHPGDVLDPVRTRIQEGKGAIRTAGPGYLAYALLDTIVDAYFPVVERLSEKLELLEERVLGRPTPRTLDHLNRVKTDLVVLRRGIWPVLDALNRLMRDKSKYLGDDAFVYLRDTVDHAAQLVDVIDSHRELVNGLLNTYLSVVANRTNEVMKVLTIMSSIFIPLTFLAGIYGMNFDHMPELHERWSYPVLMGAMGVVAIIMLIYFRRRGWLGGADDDDAD
jgi:magnesium transporter